LKGLCALKQAQGQPIASPNVRPIVCVVNLLDRACRCLAFSSPHENLKLLDQTEVDQRLSSSASAGKKAGYRLGGSQPRRPGPGPRDQPGAKTRPATRLRAVPASAVDGPNRPGPAQLGPAAALIGSTQNLPAICCGGCLTARLALISSASLATGHRPLGASGFAGWSPIS
jgi:hypothetical protein